MKINFQNLDNLQKHIISLQKQTNKEDIFLVWWCIRDLLLWLDKDPKDIDVTCSWKPQEIYNSINKTNISIFQTEKFWTITILPKWKKYQYELTPLREEWEYMDFRHPNKINWTDSIIHDSKRRDFTINCIYYYYLAKNIHTEQWEEIKEDKIYSHLEKDWIVLIKNNLIINSKEYISSIFENWKFNQEIFWKILEKTKRFWNIKSNGINIIIDPWGWIKDMIDFKINAVDDPEKRFQEDALRIIRAIRIPNILNQKLEKKHKKNSKIEEIKFFDYEKETWKAMKRNYFLVQYLPKERLKDEILKVFKEDNPFGFVSLLDELNILKFLFPKLYETKNNYQPVRYHPFDTYTHTMLCLWNIQKNNKKPLVKFGILYHDVWKPDQYYFAQLATNEQERKQVHWSGFHHPVIGSYYTQKDFQALWFSKKQIQEICFYVEKHHLPGELLNSSQENIPKKIKKYMIEYWYTKLRNLVDICISDRLGQFNPMQSPNTESLQNLKKLIKQIYKKQWEFSQKDLQINWNDIIKNFNLQPSPKIWEILNYITNWVVEDIENRNNKEKILQKISEEFFS